MPRYYVEKDGEWNIFSTIIDDFLFDEFICLDALKARLLYERFKQLTEDIDSLLTDRPKVNVMTYEEAVERIRKTEPTISKMEQVDKPQTCFNCKHNVTKHTFDHACGGCTNMNRWEKDEPQTDRSVAVGKRSDVTADKYNLYGKTTTDEPQTDCAWK